MGFVLCTLEKTRNIYRSVSAVTWGVYHCHCSKNWELTKKLFQVVFSKYGPWLPWSCRESVKGGVFQVPQPWPFQCICLSQGLQLCLFNTNSPRRSCESVFEALASETAKHPRVEANTLGRENRGAHGQRLKKEKAGEKRPTDAERAWAYPHALHITLQGPRGALVSHV